MEKILVIFEFPETTTQAYDKVTGQLFSEGFLPNKGLVFHAAAKNNGNIIISDVWESQEIFNGFMEKIKPIMMKAGMPRVQPQIIPVHNIMP